MSAAEGHVFNTLDVRPWDKNILKNSKEFKVSPNAVGFPTGLNWLDIDNNHNIRINAHTELDAPKKSIKVNLDSWSDSVLYSAGCTWLEVYAKDPDFQFGKFSTTEDHPWDHPQVQTSSVITFPKKFDVLPQVVVWLTELDIAHNTNWRVKAFVSEVTLESFTIHIDTWADTILYSGTATWVAYPSDRPYIASGSFNTTDVRPWNVPEAVNKGQVQFNKTFRCPPTVRTAFNSLDVDHRGNLRIKVNTSEVTSEGMDWNIDSWADTTLYSVGASYIAIDEEIRCIHSGRGAWKDGIFLKIINILFYFLLLGSNAGIIPFVGKETYVTPARWAYFIWCLIHLLFVGTLVYQFYPAGKRDIIDGISWRFPLLIVFSSIYVNLWIAKRYVWAFVFSLFVSSIVTHIYYIVKKHHHPKHYFDDLFVHLPFSLYHGWTTVLVVVTGFAAFGVNAATHPASIWTKIGVFVALLFLESVSAGYAVTTAKGDLPGSVAITWSLFAIFAHQTSVPFIHWSALGFAVLSLIWIVKAAIGHYKEGGIRLPVDEERA